jgi:hypothetical protein
MQRYNSSNNTLSVDAALQQLQQHIISKDSKDT